MASTPTQINEEADKRHKGWLVNIAITLGIAAIIVGVCLLLGKVSLAVYVLVVSVLITFIFYRPVNWMHRKGLPRAVAALICLVVLLAVIAAVFLVLAPALMSQVGSFIESIPSIVNTVNGILNDGIDQFESVLDVKTIDQMLDQFWADATAAVTGMASSSVSSIIDISISAFNAIMVIFFSFIASFWFLVDFHKIGEEIRVIVGPKYGTTFSEVVKICAHSFGGYLMALIITAVFSGVLTGILFAIFGVPYPMAMGFLNGLMSIIPVIGPWIAGISVAVVGLSSSLFHCIAAVVITVVVRLIADAVITPRAMASTAQLHAAVSIIAVAAGLALGGPLGMVLSVPVVSAALGVFAYFFELRTGRTLMSPDGALFKRNTKQNRPKPTKRNRKKGKLIDTSEEND